MSASGKEIVGVIPARWASTRFPGKPLAEIAGRPLLHWVLERASRARSLSRVLVATDDGRIRDCAAACGAEVAMTSSEHLSGTDRVAEAVAGLDPDGVVNIQGDEPLIDPALIDSVAGVLAEEDGGWDMVTAAVPISEADDVADPNVVKVVCDAEGRALYFSRSAIPCNRDGVDLAEIGYWRHIGIYGYRSDFLSRLVASPECRLERSERLEQLRALYIGCRMRVVESDHVGLGVDTPADIVKVERLMAANEKGY